MPQPSEWTRQPEMRNPSTFLRQLEQLGRVRFALLMVLLVLSASWLVAGIVTSWWQHPPGLVNELGATIGRDFVAPYSAASLALSGNPEAAYEPERIHAAERQVIGAPLNLIPWLYPPTALLLMLPLALLPYLAALALWLGGQIGALLLLLRRLFPHPLAPMAALVFPGTAQSLIAGQNGLFSTVLVGGGLYYLDRRPLLAGLFFGTLTYKPQMALATFAALLFGAYWRTFAITLATSAGLAVASAAILGIAPWFPFVHQLDAAGTLLGDGRIPLDRMVTVFAALRLAGVGTAVSSLAQSSVTLLALGAIAYVWRQRASLHWRGSVLATAIPLTTPYAFHYDLVLLLLPMAWLVWAGVTTGFRRGEVPLLIAAWMSPVAGWLLAEQSHVLLTPAVLALMLLNVLRRVTLPSLAAPSPASPGFSPRAANGVHHSAELSDYRASSL